MNHQHDMPVNGGQNGPAGPPAGPVGTPRYVCVTVGKHFNLSMSLSVSPAFLTLLAAAIGVVGGNYWFLL